MSSTWTPRDIPDQTGRRAIVTGSNSGIGWHTALELARAGAEVTIASRDAGRATVAVARIRAILPCARVQTASLDLTRFASIRAFALDEINDSRPIDLLVNNAGVMALPQRRVSPDGHEVQFATNVLGPFVLTGLLLPRLLEAAAPRVVTVSSSAHGQGGPLPIEDLESERDYQPMRAYSKTKLANILFTCELQRRAGDRLLAVACHPGACRTNLFVDTSTTMKLITLLMRPMLQSAAGGAEPTLRAATTPEAKLGAYFGPGGLFGLRGSAVEVEIAPFARDEAAGRRLWDELEQISGTTYPLI